MVFTASAASNAGAGPFSVNRLDSQKVLPVSRSENNQMYVTLPAASLDITSRGSIGGRLSAMVPDGREISVSLNRARNEARTLFVYLNVDTSSNSLPGKSVTLNV